MRERREERGFRERTTASLGRGACGAVVGAAGAPAQVGVERVAARARRPFSAPRSAAP